MVSTEVEFEIQKPVPIVPCDYSDSGPTQNAVIRRHRNVYEYH